MPLGEQALLVEQNCDYPPDGYFFFSPDPSGLGNNANAVPYNVTGTQFEMQVREAQDPASTLLLTLTIGAGLALAAGTFVGGPPVPANPNGFTITITNAQTGAMPGGEWFYDIIQTAGALKTCFLSGPFVVRLTVTR